MTDGSRVPDLLTDPDDARLAPFRDVARPAVLARSGLFVAEGRLVVETLLASPRYAAGLVGLLLTRAAHEALRAGLGSLPPSSSLWVAEGPALLKDLTGYRFHQGCLALVRRPSPLGLDELDAAFTPGPRLVVGLEGVTDPDNVGTIFRTAAAFGAEALVLSEGCADPLYRKALRTSMGNVLQLPFTTLEAWGAALERFRSMGYRIVALTPRDDAVSIDDLDAGGRNLLLFGSEERGLADQTFRQADVLARIPMARTVDSLNVAASAAIACFRLRGPGASS